VASIRKTETGYKAEVYVAGKRKAKRFKSQKEAKAWAAEMEVSLANAKAGVDPNRTVRNIFTRYSEEVSSTKRTGRNEQVRLERLGRDSVADLKLIEMKPADWALWRDERLKQVSPASVQREMNILHHAFEVARKEWGWLESNPLSDISRPRSPPARDRRISQEEIDKLCIALGFFEESSPSTKSQRVAVAFLFAIETAMRAGEICGLKPGDIQGRVANLPMTKNGTARQVPLSKRALELLELLDQKKLFDMTGEQLSTLFRKARNKTDIEDLTFHDTRHEAITRLASKLNVLELARMVGHRDIKMLQRYYNATADELAARLD
jgi:integrase